MPDQWWQQFSDARRLLSYLNDACRDAPISPRKLRLFAAACGRAEVRANGPLYRAVEMAERFADGAASAEQLFFANLDGPEGCGSTFPYCIAHEDAAKAAYYTAGRPGISEARRKAEADLLRCIVRDPFSRSTLDAACLTPTVIALARGVYDEGRRLCGELDPVWLGVLADAIEEAGCGDDELLEHLRGPGPHVRGCWAVDLILSKDH